jgi:hypothetical protein
VLDRLSRFSRVVIRHFLEAWEAPVVPRRKLPKSVREAQDAEREAKRRGDTKAVHAARVRLREARLDGLAIETYGRHWRVE